MSFSGFHSPGCEKLLFENSFLIGSLPEMENCSYICFFGASLQRDIYPVWSTEPRTGPSHETPRRTSLQSPRLGVSSKYFLLYPYDLWTTTIWVSRESVNPRDVCN